ncbi:MAG: acyl-CoA dehydrogenase family protein [Candidatus Acidiferrales bacterium]
MIEEMPEAPEFTLEEQELFRRDARRFVEAEVIPYVDEWERTERIPGSFWKRIGELGYLGLEFPEAYGGSESTFTAKRIFLEELSRCGAMAVALSVGVHTDMSSTYILDLGTEEQRQKYLPQLIQGEKICGIAITEPDAGSDIAGIRMQVRRRKDSYVLNGSKTFISNGVYGDVFVVAARTQDVDQAHRTKGISLFIVERGIKGFSTSSKLEKLGWWASDTAELSFQDVEIPSQNLLGKEGEGFGHLVRNLQRERLIIAIVACASAIRVQERAIAYARDRHAFGQPLVQFQALRHRIADMVTLTEVASTFIRDLAGHFEAGRATDSLVSMGKLFATDVANQVADTAVQVFGGYGCTREFRIERFFRDARMLKIAGGSSEILREIIAKRLQLI